MHKTSFEINLFDSQCGSGTKVVNKCLSTFVRHLETGNALRIKLETAPKQTNPGEITTNVTISQNTMTTYIYMILKGQGCHTEVTSTQEQDALFFNSDRSVNSGNKWELTWNGFF